MLQVVGRDYWDLVDILLRAVPQGRMQDVIRNGKLPILSTLSRLLYPAMENQADPASANQARK